MALEIKYVPFKDEGNCNYPKIMRLVYDEKGSVVASSEAPLKEAQVAQPDCIEGYFDLLRNYFNDIATFLDSQMALGNDVSIRLFEVATFCLKYVQDNPVDYSLDYSASNEETDQNA